MSEQLWYTWSTSGFGTANGFRVRAASANLTDVEGQRVRSFANLARYKLSQDVDPFLPPQKAPLCLAFLKTDPGQESVLIQKTFSGLDGVGRPGAYFSHLIADLPPISSRCPGGQVPFSAREAISLWKSPLWKDSESSLSPGKRDLEQIPPTDLRAGPLTEQTVMQIKDLFGLVMQAFLTLAVSGERKRLYLAGSPDTIATLIWGITHALPRTLSIMRGLTFSTYEADLESDTNPLIVGTYWLSDHLKQGHEQALLDFPPQYYQINNPYGFAIKCDSSRPPTPFTPSTQAVRYTQFVLNCFSSGPAGMIELNNLLDEAEKRDVREWSPFFSLYTSFQEMLSKEDVTRILQEMIAKVEEVGTQGKLILEQEKLAVLEMPSLESITLAAEILKRDNVQRSIIYWIVKDVNWWQTQGHAFVSRLYRLAYLYSPDALTTLGNSFVHRVVSSRAWHKKDGEDLVGALLPLVQVGVRYAPSEVLSAFAHLVMTRVQDSQNVLSSALLPFTQKVTEYVCQSIQRDDAPSTLAWTTILAICTERITAKGHSYLLEQLSGLGYTTAYEKWWQQYGATMIDATYRATRRHPGTELSRAYSRFALKTAQELVAAIQINQTTRQTFWHGVLDRVTASAPATEPEAWAAVLTQLAATPYTEAFRRWWNSSGKSAVMTISQLPPEQADAGLQEALTTFCRKPAQEIQSALKMNEVILLAFWEEMLVSIAPYQNRPAIWLDLLNGLTVETLSASTSAFTQWWPDQGREATRYLCQLIERTPQGPSYLNLTSFARALDGVLSWYIKAEVQEGQQRYEKAITFYLDALLDAVPAQLAGIWLDQVQKLTNEFAHRNARWSLRAILLEHWSKVPLLRTKGGQPPLLQWLEPTWSELDAFLSLQIVDTWKKIAIAGALETYKSSPNQVVVDIVKRHNTLFAEVLPDLFKAPPTQNGVIQFFKFLAQQNYVHLFDLLSGLLAACDSQQDIAEQLLGVVTMTTPREIANLLENHCKELLARPDLSPTMLRLLKTYFETFDVEYLDTDPTRELLGVLQRREKSLPSDLQQSVSGWYAIAEFLSQPQASQNALRDLSHSLRTMSQMVPEMQKKLTAKLTPHFVELVKSEAGLTRVLDNVGRANGGALLQEMAKIVGEKYGQQRPPVRIAPYVRIILQESDQFDPSQKETFIDRCFQLLFRHMEAKTRDKYWPEPLWGETLVEEWMKAQTRIRALDLNKAFNRFKQAVKEEVVPDIVSSYDPTFETRLSPQEAAIVNLAFKFTRSFEANDDAGMVEALRGLKQYLVQPRYMPEQIPRINLAVQRVTQQQAAAQAAPRSNPASIWVENNSSSAAQERRAGTSLSPTSSQQEAQPAAGDNQRSVATVKGQLISEIWLQRVINLKLLYLRNRQLQLQTSIQRVEYEGTPQEKKALSQMKRNEKEIGKLINDVIKLRKVALDELIDDVLIQEEIGKIPASDAQWRSLEGGMEGSISFVYTSLKTNFGTSNPELRSTEESTVMEIKTVLAIFIRRDLFDNYLKLARQSTSENWLKVQRERANVTIYDAHAPQRGGIKAAIFGE